MKDLRTLDRLRDRAGEMSIWGLRGNSDAGVFDVPLPPNGDQVARVIASSGLGWDHVSVSLPHRTLTWDELEHVKRLFFKAQELAVQFHLPPSKHISVHPHCLHLWRPHFMELPLPPPVFV